MTSAADSSRTMSPRAPKRAMPPERAAKLKLDQLVMVVQNIRPGVIGLPLLALTICFVLAEWVPLRQLEWWLAGVVAATAFYSIGHWLFLRTGRYELNKADRWIWILVGQQAAFSIVWNLPPIIFWSECNDLGRMF